MMLKIRNGEFWRLLRQPMSWTVIMVAAVLLLLLAGCARNVEPPYADQTVVSAGVSAANETLDWATNNLPDTADIRLLMGQIVACRDSLQACGDTCAQGRKQQRAELSAAHAKTNMWRTIAAALAVILAGVWVSKLRK